MSYVFIGTYIFYVGAALLREQHAIDGSDSALRTGLAYSVLARELSWSLQVSPTNVTAATQPSICAQPPIAGGTWLRDSVGIRINESSPSVGRLSWNVREPAALEPGGPRSAHTFTRIAGATRLSNGNIPTSGRLWAREFGYNGDRQV